MTSLRWYHVAFILMAVVVLVSCNSEQPSAKAPETVSAAAKAPVMPQPVTAAQALSSMQGFAAKQWAPDAMPLHIESEPNSEANGHDGKATVWTGVFASMRRNEIRSFHWSGSLDPSAPVKGVSGAPNTSPLTPDLSSKMFQGMLFKHDTDKAITVAQAHGGDAVLKKNPDQSVKYIVVSDPKRNVPVVYVIFGEDLTKNHGYGVVNGMTGEFMKGAKGT